MKIPIQILAVLSACAGISKAHDAVLPYHAFGPQVIAYELIGMEWWQWDAHGDSDPNKKYPIKVVVYWDQTLDATKKVYPTDPRSEKDYRYLKYTDAVKHMRKAIKELEESKLDAGKIRDGLKKLTAIKTKTEQGSAPDASHGPSLQR